MASNSDDKEIDVVQKQITYSRWGAGILIVIVLAFYVINFRHGLSDNHEKWGTFGDFVGGTLNPLLAALAFYWLTSSIRLQLKELRDTRQVLSETATHQEKLALLEERNVSTQENILKTEEKNINTQQQILELQKQSLKNQNITAQKQRDQIALQNFESLFFQLLKTKQDATDNILIFGEDFLKQNETLDKPIFYGKDAISRIINGFKTSHYEKTWENYYEEKNILHVMGSYFRICYQIVKLIDQTDVLKLESEDNKKIDNLYRENQKKYFDIFRATLNQHELEAFFFNCLSNYGAPKFKNLITKYGLFEPLLIETNDNDQIIPHVLTRYAYQYDKKIFESNKSWSEYFNDINKIDLNLNSEQISNSYGFLNNGYYVRRKTSTIKNVVWNYRLDESKINLDSNLPFSIREIDLDIKNSKNNLRDRLNENKFKIINDPFSLILNKSFLRKMDIALNVIVKFNYWYPQYKNVSAKINRYQYEKEIFSSPKYNISIYLLLKHGICYKEFINYRSAEFT